MCLLNEGNLFLITLLLRTYEAVIYDQVKFIQYSI